MDRKKVVVIVLAVVCAVLMAGCGSKAEKQEPPFTVKVDGSEYQGVRASDVGMAVIDIKETNVIQGSFSKTPAQGKFIIVRMVVVNGQKDAITVDCSSFKLVKDDTEYSYSTEASTALQLKSGNAKGFLTKVNPGNSIILEVPFDVPVNGAEFKLKARGGFSGQEVVLPLQVQKKQ